VPLNFLVQELEGFERCLGEMAVVEKIANHARQTRVEVSLLESVQATSGFGRRVPL
jgi:hypothetical protein